MHLIYFVLLGIAGLLSWEKVTKQQFSGHVFGWASLPLGLVINGWVLLVAQLVGQSWGWWLWGMAVAAALVMMGWQRQRLVKLTEQWRHKLKTLGRADVGFLFVIIATGLVIGLGQLTHEYIHSDGLSLWFMRGKVFFLDQGIKAESQRLPAFTSVNEAGNRFAQQSLARYPVLVPLNVATTYGLYGKEAVPAAKSLWVGLYLSGLGVLWMVGRERWGGTSVKSGLGVLLLVVLPVMWRYFGAHWFGGADLWLALYYLLGTASIYWWGRKKKLPDLWLGLCFFSAATMVKVEGIVALTVWFLVLWWGRRCLSWRVVVGSGLLLLIPSVVWYYVSAGFGLKSDYLYQAVSGLVEGEFKLERFLVAGTQMIVAFGRVQDYLLFLLLAISIPLLVLRKRGRQRWLGLYLLPVTGWLFILFSYGVNNIDLQSLLSASLARVYSQWIPMLAYLSVVGIGELEG